jgi:HAMP domain-containing protein
MKLSPEQLAKITPEQLAKLTPEQQTLVMRSRAAQQGNFDTVARLKELANDGHKLAAMEVQQNGEVPIPANEVNEARAKLVQAAERIKQLRGSSNIARWYHLTKDDARARMFFTTVCIDPSLVD